MNNIIYKNYYLNILKNLKQNNLFYKNSDIEFTYKEALEFSIKLIGFLKKNKLKKGTICTYSNKSFEMYAAIFPILVSGFTWAPLSTSYPKHKIIEITNQIKPVLIISDSKIQNKIKTLKYKITNFNVINAELIKFPQKKNEIIIKQMINKLDLNINALIYFTSGSTGKSKGIMISHKNIISDVFAQISHLHKKKKNLIFGDYYDTAFSIFFDIYFPAIYLSSTLSPATNISDVYLPLEHIKRNKVNTLVCVPSTIQRLKEYYKNKVNLNLNLLILTGEPFYLDLLKYIQKNINYNYLFNCYGGTEMSNWIFFHKCELGDTEKFKKFGLVPIGKKFNNVNFKISNNELIVKGPTISQGYLDKSLNSNFNFSKFNSFYTSDYVVKYKDVIICRGRNDKMIKIRGYRVDMSDVEANIRNIKYVKQCLIFEKNKKNYENYMCAAIETNQNKVSKLRSDLSKNLPSYMIPKEIKFIKKFPNNSNGKIDRKKILKIFN